MLFRSQTFWLTELRATKGGGLPMQAPKVAGTPKRGGTWTSGVTSTYKQHDAHTALATNIYHHIGDKGIEPHPVTNKLLPHIIKSWEVSDPTGTTLTFKVDPNVFVHEVAPWNGRRFDAEDVAWNLERIGGLYADREKTPLGSYQRASMVANIQKEIGRAHV